MANTPKVLTFELDRESILSLREAFPAWDIEPANKAATAPFGRDWNPEKVELLVLGPRPALATLGLCRKLRSQAGRAHTPLFVLVTPAQETLISDALAAGADSCLVLPVHAKELVSAFARVGAGNRPGQHTLNLEQAQRADAWRDHGGEA